MNQSTASHPSSPSRAQRTARTEQQPVVNLYARPHFASIASRMYAYSACSCDAGTLASDSLPTAFYTAGCSCLSVLS